MKKIIIALNVIGLICLVYLGIPYLLHDMSINPDAMLSGPRWDVCGFGLTIGLIPLIILNVLEYKFIDIKKYKVLFFIPSIICLIIVFHYLVFATDWSNEKTKDVEVTISCELNGSKYNYSIYLEDAGYSLGMDEDDTIELSKIDYSSKDKMIESIKNYYLEREGFCTN